MSGGSIGSARLQRQTFRTSRLLDFASQGGTLIVQYNQTVNAFNDGHYTPYPMTLSSERVNIEEGTAPLAI